MSGLFTLFLNLKSSPSRSLKFSPTSTIFSSVAMPFRRRRRGRRPRRRRRMNRRSFTSRRGRALVLDPERKFGDLNSGVPSTVDGTILFLNNIGGGSANTQRIGVQVINTSSLIMANVDMANGTTPATVKMWLVLDKSPNGELVTFNEFLATGLLKTTFPRNLGHTLRLQVLWTRTMSFDVFNANKHVKMFKRLRFKSRWLGALNGIANLQSGALYLLHASDIAAAANPPFIELSHRLRYVG